MRMRRLGRQGLVVPSPGLGCMGMSWSYGPADDEESIRVLHRALELGVSFWDTAEVYGPFRNEELVGKALRGKQRNEVVIATKFGFSFNEKNERVGFDSTPAHIRESVEGSLRRLGTDYIDLYYQHRLDPKTPIEDTIGAVSDLIRAGKVRYLGLSEVGPATLRRAHAVHPVSALQSEYSLWERGVEGRILDTVRELGIGFVAYSPMGRGMLTGDIRRQSDLGDSDFRRHHPRFAEENLTHNLKLVNEVQAIASAHDATAAQVAIAWVMRQGDDIVPIPGTKRVRYLEENAGAASLALPESAWAALDRVIASFKPAGARYPESMLSWVDTE